MGKFTTKLDVELTDDSANDGGGNWMLDKPLSYTSTSGAVYVVPVGFVTDFASVPRVPFIFEVFGNSAHSATTLHDWLYTTKPVSRAAADLLLLEAMRSTNISMWKALSIYLAVRLFGASHW